jgi:hypothetical protein
MYSSLSLIQETYMHHLSEAQWIAIAAHRLQHRWRSINPGQLDDLAADLWRDEQLRALDPSKAVDTWLAPIWTPDSPPRPH